jgi:hypothetical protein
MKWKADKIIDYLNKWKDWQEYICCKVESKEGRTKYQNSFFYWLFSSIEKQAPFSSEVIKQYILSRVFWKQEVYWELVNIKTQTSKLTKREAMDLINWIIDFCIENWIEMRYTSRELQSLQETYL